MIQRPRETIKKAFFSETIDSPKNLFRHFLLNPRTLSKLDQEDVNFDLTPGSRERVLGLNDDFLTFLTGFGSVVTRVPTVCDLLGSGSPVFGLFARLYAVIYENPRLQIGTEPWFLSAGPLSQWSARESVERT